MSIDYRTHPLAQLPAGDKLRVCAVLLHVIGEIDNPWHQEEFLSALAEDLSVDKYFLAQYVRRHE
jgi:hypothetical protein